MRQPVSKNRRHGCSVHNAVVWLALLSSSGCRDRPASPVEFRIVAAPQPGEPTILFRETYTDERHWAERSVDLTSFAGQTITLTLETYSDEPGTVAFWGAPTVTGVRRTDKPNVIFYIIDGGSADYMSVYGYNRRTTPNLEGLAAEGALFERAYSNSIAPRSLC